MTYDTDDTVSLFSDPGATHMTIPANEIKVGDLLKLNNNYFKVLDIDAIPNAFAFTIMDCGGKVLTKRYELKDIIRIE